VDEEAYQLVDTTTDTSYVVRLTEAITTGFA